jgi:DNA-binding MarR family transcriptional regulator
MLQTVDTRETTRSVRVGQACACFNIRKTARLVTQLYDETLRPTGLRITQFGLLMATSRLGPVTVTRLAEVMAMDRTTLTRNLRPLEKQEFLQIEPGEDRRERQVTLTDGGRQALRDAFPLWEKAQARMAESFGQGRLQRLLIEMSDLRKASRKR